MSQIRLEIGKKIRILRKKRKMTLSDLSKIINKNIATISKYENGEIVIDIETLYKVAAALGTTLDHLLYQPQESIKNETFIGFSKFFNGATQFYSYIYHGKSKKIIRCVFDIISKIEHNKYKIMMYMNFENYDEYYNSEYSYIGYIKYYDEITYISLVNRDTPMEEASVQMITNYQDTEIKWALFSSFSSYPTMTSAVKMLLSKNKLEENRELKSKLKISNKDIQTLKLYNMFTVL